MSTATDLQKNCKNYNDCLFKADEIAVNKEQDYALEMTTFTFKDGSKLQIEGVGGTVRVLETYGN